jgi:hypothetical protein
MFVIGVAGQAQMGKDTLADRLQFKLNKWDNTTLEERVQELEHEDIWQRRAFAANVKKVFCETFGVDLDFVEKWKTVPESPPGFDMTVRQALQFIGDGFRKIRPTIWLDLVFRDKSRPIILSDVRYVNEFLRVKEEGGMNVLVGRPDKLNSDPNGSEAQIRPYIEWCINTFPEHMKCVPLRQMHGWPFIANGAPDHIEAFDVFVRNDGTKEEFFDTIDKMLVPFVENFVFDFPSEEKEEESCLILS